MKNGRGTIIEKIVVDFDDFGHAKTDYSISRTISTRDSKITVKGKRLIESTDVSEISIDSPNLDPCRLAHKVSKGCTILVFEGEMAKSEEGPQVEWQIHLKYRENRKAQHLPKVSHLLKNLHMASLSYAAGSERTDFTLEVSLPNLARSKGLSANRHSVSDKTSFIGDEVHENRKKLTFKKTLIPNARFGPIQIAFWVESTKLQVILRGLGYVGIGVLMGLLGNFLYSLVG